MNTTIIPPILKSGDTVRVIAPSQSLSTVAADIQKTALENLNRLGLVVTFGKYVNEIDLFKSSSIQSRIEDLQEAFTDKNVKAIIAARGGYNANQLLDYIDWELIKKNPKIFCGFSDNTVLNNAIFAKTNITAYSGPNFMTLGQKKYADYTLEYFKKCFMSKESYTVKPSEVWLDDKWQNDQENRSPIKNDGYLVINDGEAEGRILGGNLCSFNLLQGTQYFPNIRNFILFIEEDDLAKEDTLIEFDRNLQSLLQLPNFADAKGLVIGRFQVESKVKNDEIIAMVKSKKELSRIPVLANVDFGHTSPQFSFPIGGKIKIRVFKGDSKIEVVKN